MTRSPAAALLARRPLVARPTTLGLVWSLAVCATGSLRSQCPDGTPPPCGARPARLASAPASNSVAVLYFATRDTSDLYLAEGLTEDIATGLGRLAPRVEVKAPSSVRRAQRENPGDLRGIGRALGVRFVVDGGLRRTPGGYRVSIRLVNTQSELTAWGETYDQSSAGLLELPPTVAQAVAVAVAGGLAPAERTSLAVRPTRDPAAWEHVLRGNFLLARRTQGDAERAIAEYQAAVELDTSYVEAYASLGFAYSIAHNWAWRIAGLPPESLLARATGATDHALALDTTSAVAWYARGSTLVERDPVGMVGAVAAFRRAIALDPKRAEPSHQLGIVLLLEGDDAGAATAFRQALARDPERPITLTWLGNAALHARRHAEAIAWTDSALAVAPDFAYALRLRAVVQALDGDAAGGRRDAAAALRATRGDSLLEDASLALVEALAGDTAAALRHARIVTETPGPVLDEALSYAAGALLAAGDRDGALSTLEHCPPTAFLRWYMGYEVFDGLRDEPRFRRLVAELGG